MDEEYFEASIDPDIELQLRGEIVANINANVKRKNLFSLRIFLQIPRKFYFIKLHSRIVWALSALRSNPCNILTWIFYITCFTMNTILIVNLKFRF